jgi:hypothetical protein
MVRPFSPNGYLRLFGLRRGSLTRFVTVLVDVGVEAQRSVVLPLDQSLALKTLDQSLALKKINWEDCCMAAVAAAESEGAALKIAKRSDRPPGYRDDLGHPAHSEGAGSTPCPPMVLQSVLA